MPYIYFNSSYCEKAGVFKTLIIQVQQIRLQISFWCAPTHADIIQF